MLDMHKQITASQPAKPRAIAAIITGLALCSVLALSPVFAANDADYLDAIAPDEVDTQVNSAVTVEEISAGVDENSFPPDLDQVGFEQDLRGRFTGSFMFYSKLTDRQKLAVYDEYLVNKDIELIRKKIIALFSSR